MRGLITTANDDQGRTPQTKVVHGYVDILNKDIPDINGNGIVDAGDALAALKMSVGLIPQDMILNVDKKDDVTSNDARLLLQMVVQGGSSVPVSNSTVTPSKTGNPSPSSTTTANARKAYQEYISAYNKLTSLMSKGQGETPAGQQAFAAYKIAKERYEAAEKDQPAVHDVEG